MINAGVEQNPIQSCLSQLWQTSNLQALVPLGLGGIKGKIGIVHLLKLLGVF